MTSLLSSSPSSSSSSSLLSFRPSAEKVYHLDVHPTQPWVVSSDGLDNVVVWDWQHGQVVYQLNAGGVDERRLVDAQLQKIAEGEGNSKGRASAAGTEAIRGGGVKDVKFYDDDVRYWTAWTARSAASESPTVTSGGLSLAAIGSSPSAIRGRRFLVMCCENKAIIADLVTMRTRDIPKLALENRSPLCVEFLPRSSSGGPFLCFGAADGAIRVFSFADWQQGGGRGASWQMLKKFSGGHKGGINCLLPFMAGNGEMLLASGGTEGTISLWGAESSASNQTTKEVAPKLTLPKAHDGGVHCIALSRVVGAAPHLVSCGADKSVAVWDTTIFREIRRTKPIAKLAPHTILSWRHPRAPVIEALAVAKDSTIWAIDAAGTSRSLVDLAAQMPPTPQLANGKKVKAYCLQSHPLLPHLLVTGTNMGVTISLFHPSSLPAAAAIPSLPNKTNHAALCAANRRLFLVSFRAMVAQEGAAAAANAAEPADTLGTGDGRPTTAEGGGRQQWIDPAEALLPQVKQFRSTVASLPHDGRSVLSVSKSGRFLAILWPEVPFFQILAIPQGASAASSPSPSPSPSAAAGEEWRVVDSGPASMFAWDTCSDRYAIIGGAAIPKVSRVSSSSSSRLHFRSSKRKEQKEAEAAAAAVVAAAAAAMAVAAVEIRRVDEGGNVQSLCSAIDSGRKEPVTALHSGALLGVAYRVPRRAAIAGSFSAGPAASAVSSTTAGTSLAALAPGSELASEKYASYGEQAPNFQLISWETSKPVGSMLLAPDWSAWDPIVEYCAFAYPHDVAISSLRPQFRCLGRVAISQSTGGVWHRRQLYLATPTSIECVFVDAGVSEVDVATRRRKLLEKRLAEDARVVAEKGELALLTMESVREEVPQEREQLRPPMLQVVRLASFSTSPAVPPISMLSLPQLRPEHGDSGASLLDGAEARLVPQLAVGGGVAVTPGRLPLEQRRAIGPLVVVGVRDGVLWMVDSFISLHAISLSHPGIRCRCLAAHGDPVGSVKWASKLGREHHDDLAKFLVGMGYAREALHLPGLTKRLEFDLAMQCNDLDRALDSLYSLCRLRLSSAAAGSTQDPFAAFDAQFDSTGVMAMAAAQSSISETSVSVAAFAREFLSLIDAADATGNAEVAIQALRQLAAAGLLEGALSLADQRRLAVRLAAHGEGGRLQLQCAALVKAAEGRGAADAAALLGDANLLEKVWHDTGMLPEAALHAQSHGRPTLANLLKEWNRLLQKQEINLAATRLLHTAHFNTLFGNAHKTDDPLSLLMPSSKEPAIQVIPPGTFSQASSADGSLAPAAAAAGGGGGPGGGWFGAGVPPSFAEVLARPTGIQGMTKPLDLSVLEGAGKGPAPQKATAIAVPVIFSAFEKQEEKGLVGPVAGKAKEEELSDFFAGVGGGGGKSEQPVAAPIAMTTPVPNAPAAPSARGTKQQSMASRAGPTMADFEWAALEATQSNFLK